MKLFAKYNRINLLVTIIIFLLASAAYYFFIRYILIGQIDNDLKIEQREIQTYVNTHNRLPETMPVRDQLINYFHINEPYTQKSFTSQQLYDSLEKKKRVFRQFIFGVEVDGEFFKVSVSKSLESTDKLIRSIILVTFVTILLILATSLMINRILLKHLWSPFYNALNKIKNFKIDNKQHLSLSVSSIDEFDFMNKTLENATNQAQHDYLLLKEFTENASHEMQTPLAIIRSKLDLLIQDESLKEEQSKTIQTAYNAIQRLARLNQSLLLLAKIENRQFAETSQIQMKEKIMEKVEAFHELWENENISIDLTLNEVCIKMNNELAEILLNNILSNATKHNFKNGMIKIELNKNELIVSNTAMLNGLDQDRLFRRFYKQSSSNEQNGLGLSIIKQICDVSGFNVVYYFTDSKHRFKIAWNHN